MTRSAEHDQPPEPEAEEQPTLADVARVARLSIEICFRALYSPDTPMSDDLRWWVQDTAMQIGYIVQSPPAENLDLQQPTVARLYTELQELQRRVAAVESLAAVQG